MDHISTGATSARQPGVSFRSPRHTALQNAKTPRGAAEIRPPQDEIPAQVGGYLSGSSRACGPHGSGLLSKGRHPHSEQRREHP